MTVGVRPWWGCSNATCCVKFSLYSVGFVFFHTQSRSHPTVHSEKQDTDEISVALAGYVKEGDE